MTYEGARSITGPYLGLLGLTGTTIGIVSGVGELVGYAVRLGSGYLADFSGRYWAVTICGYLLNLLAVPLLALAGNWQIAVVLIIAERMGRAIRSPPRDAMLSHAAGQTGLGWGFGLHQALDQTGAVVGPLIVSGVLFLGDDYRAAFAVLLAPALVSISLVLAARLLFPRPRDFELAPPALDATGLAPTFRVYLVAVGFIAAGFADFALIAYHFDKAAIMPATWIPIAYAIAMAADGAAGLMLGSLFDRIGLRAMILATVISAAAAPLVFSAALGSPSSAWRAGESAPALRIRLCAPPSRNWRRRIDAPPPSASSTRFMASPGSPVASSSVSSMTFRSSGWSSLRRGCRRSRSRCCTGWFAGPSALKSAFPSKH
jgi:MFS family permease